jgi:hypothetical protein
MKILSRQQVHKDCSNAALANFAVSMHRPKGLTLSDYAFIATNLVTWMSPKQTNKKIENKS